MKRKKNFGLQLTKNQIICKATSMYIKKCIDITVWAITPNAITFLPK